jgi:D-3-phosphoglycerate dehydrogenase / 2-oxoglutarate reductase
MPHILVAGKIHAAGIALLEGRGGVTFEHVEDVSEAAYLPHLAAADALVIRTQPLRADSIAGASRLRIVSRHGVGYDAVDVAALSARRIPLTIVGDVNSVSVAEQSLALILACAKRVVRADRAVRSGGWGWRNRLEPTELAGRTLLIFGYGRIGQRLARMAAGMDMQVLAFDPGFASDAWPQGPARRVSDPGAALAAADVISLNMPRSGRPVLGEVELASTKPGVIIVNTARGGLIDEAALVRALADGRVGAAGIDVFDSEPPLPHNPLYAFDQVILSPHIAGLTAEAGERMAVSSVQNVLDFFDGRLNPALVVNRDALA